MTAEFYILGQVYTYLVMFVSGVEILLFYFYFAKPRLKNGLLTIILGILMIASYRFTTDAIGYGNRIWDLVRSMIFAVFVMVALFHWDSLRTLAIASVLSYVIQGVSMALSVVIANRILTTPFDLAMDYSYELNPEGYLIATVLNTMIFIFLMSLFFLLDSVRKNSREKWRYICIAAMTVFQVLIVLVYCANCEHYNYRVAIGGLLLIAACVGADTFFVLFVTGISEKDKALERYRQILQQRQQEYEYYRMQSVHVEQMRRLRHEYVNQLQTFFLLLDGEPDREQLQQLLEEYTVQLKTTEVSE